MAYSFDEIIDRGGSSCVKYDLREKVFGKGDVMPFWVADMDFRTPDFIISALKKRLEHEVLGYSIRPDSFQQAVLRWTKDRYDWEVSAEEVMFCPGVVPGLTMAVIALSDPGDKVVVQTPVYFPFYTLVKGSGRELIYNQLKEDKGCYSMDNEDFKRQIDEKTRILILSNPHNPVGRAWTKAELAEIGNICLENDIIILSDEIHSDLVFKPHTFMPLAAVSPELAMRSMSFISPSKSFNIAGLSTAVAISANEEFRQAYEKKMDDMHLFTGNLFGNIALEAAYRHGAEWLDMLNEHLYENALFMEEYISNNIPQIEFTKPEATYLGWLDFRKAGFNDKALRERLINVAGLGLNDGPVFGPGGSGFQRFNFACPRKVLEKGLERLQIAIRS